ncbi:S-layer homology domain-containing protein [Paenibacillus roseipurpureus]|uniref:S-layer homology domain-containing protein n=1 Tax=Paenibacillus roseopurpureus TaxID=2918901 RepID=A0AA96LUD0_9BACL|nr:S-layer homology domain-containing protein [Paenibacillus sp. MBLB1832]WNR46168.1 S-layer homology domain-containing protein [Paenibacillus sp. MBLB1832]
MVSVDAFPSTDGTASVRVSTKELLLAATSSQDKSVLIHVNNASSASAVAVSLPIGEWNQAKSDTSSVSMIRVETGLARVSMDTKLFDKVPMTGASPELLLKVERVSPAALPSDVRQVTGTNIVYDFSLSLGDQKLPSFKGDIKVELPYVLAPGEKPNQVVIYYIAGDGTLEVVKNGHYNAATGMVEFRPNHFSKYAANYTQVTFRDMDGVAWANEAVLGLAARKVIQGRSESSFVPDGDLTRAEFIQMLVQLFDLKNSAAAATFTDVAPGAWYYSAIASAQQSGLVHGQLDGSFGVNDRISREDMAVMIFRVSKLLEVGKLNASGTHSTPFQDLNQTADYAKVAVTTLQEAGLMNGIMEGYFDPKGTSTRAQAAVVLYRLFQILT